MTNGELINFSAKIINDTFDDGSKEIYKLFNINSACQKKALAEYTYLKAYIVGDIHQQNAATDDDFDL